MRPVSNCSVRQAMRSLFQEIRAVAAPCMSTADTRTYLEFVADQRLSQLGLPKRFNASNPFAFMELQDVQELSNFFERTVSAYQVGVEGDVAFDEDITRLTICEPLAGKVDSPSEIRFGIKEIVDLKIAF